jgi:hypothetical protein
MLLLLSMSAFRRGRPSFSSPNLSFSLSLSRFCGMGGILARFGNASWSSPSCATLSERRVYNVLCGPHDVPLSAYSFVALLNETASYVLIQAISPQLSLLHP